MTEEKLEDLDWILSRENSYRYQLLSRMKMDCDYYLNNGDRCADHLWAGNEKAQIAYMKAIWNIFSNKDKPEWLTWNEILTYEQRMA